MTSPPSLGRCPQRRHTPDAAEAASTASRSSPSPGGYPSAGWTTTGTYSGGDRVLYRGEPYQAKWYNVGVRPSTALVDAAASPWRPLFSLPGEPTS